MKSIFVILGSSCIFWRCQKHIFLSRPHLWAFLMILTPYIFEKKLSKLLTQLRFFSFFDSGDQLFLTPCYAWYIWIMDMHDAWSILMIDIHDGWSILMIDIHDGWSILMIDIHDAWTILMIDIHDGWSILMIDRHDSIDRLYHTIV